MPSPLPWQGEPCPAVGASIAASACASRAQCAAAASIRPAKTKATTNARLEADQPLSIMPPELGPARRSVNLRQFIAAFTIAPTMASCGLALLLVGRLGVAEFMAMTRLSSGNTAMPWPEIP